jgi:Uri superfamily endonuclease
MDKGVYCLVFRNRACTVRAGALGDIRFSAGWHIYVGSALGSGGLSRLERHIGLSKKRDRRPKWHVDYLLTDPHFFLSYAVSAVTGERLECRVAEKLSAGGIAGFGCSDCRCPSHLMHRMEDPREEIRQAFRNLGQSPVIKTIMRQDTKARV